MSEQYIDEPAEHLTFEKVWVMFQETARRFQETDKKFEEMRQAQREDRLP
ncbi:MAG: hypothetical protein LBF95_01660 [Treponema sp.]|jgi:hypothetical protein|nr:hypothetical protein [Treponema sp.]